MRHPVSTCWSLIAGASRGDAEDRQEFGLRYSPVIREYLEARWRGTPHLSDLDDAVQEVFLDCFKDNGVLERVEAGRPSGFRGFLFGVTRNVALRIETRNARRKDRPATSSFDLDVVQDRERSLTRCFDRAWAQAVMREALAEQSRNARALDADARQRVDLLGLRFGDGLAVHEIAAEWGAEVNVLYRQLAKAKSEFRQALLAVVATHNPAMSRAEVEQEAAQLLDLLA